MKTFLKLFALLVLLALPARAQQIITAQVATTNTAGTTNGETITVNGTLRTWTNNVTAISIQIQTATNIIQSWTNLFYSYAATPQSGLMLSTLSTNIVQFQSLPGKPLTLSVSTNWAAVTWYTNNISSTNAGVFRYPPTLSGAYELTNEENALVALLNDNKMTNVFNTNAPVFVNFLNLSVLIGTSNSIQQSLIGTNNLLIALIGTNGINVTNGMNAMFQVLSNYTYNQTYQIQSAAYYPVGYFQPACPNLTNICSLNLNGISYLVGEDIKLVQTNATYGNDIIRFEADSGGSLYERFEDDTTFFTADTSHNLKWQDHAGDVRLELFDPSDDYGASILQSALNVPGIEVGGLAGATYSWKPITFNDDPIQGNGTWSWPAVCVGTVTNYVDQTNNSGTSATTVNSYVVPANTFTNNGDTITRTIGVQLSAGTSDKDTQVYFAGTLIFDTGSVANGGTAGNLSIHCEITRLDSSTVAYSCSGTETDSTSSSWAKVGTIGGLNFNSTANCYEILTASGTGAASDQITVLLDNTVLKPSAAWAGQQ